MSKREHSQKIIATTSQRSMTQEDAMSRGSRRTKYSVLDEEDEWDAIQRFNTNLHFEEQRQTMMREVERKRLIKIELDKQVKEKQIRKINERENDMKYEHLQGQHVVLLGQKEKNQLSYEQNKRNEDKRMRDTQLQEERDRKALESRQQLTAERA
jgi:hypothetical protein